MKQFCLALLLFGGGLMLQGQTTITLRPTADGSVKQWINNAGTACTSATCYTEVNETTGSTNCTSSSFVKGSGVVNKSAATTNLTEQYSLTLTSIPDGAVIDSITVYSCQKRAASTSTSSNLRIVLNGATTNCASNSTANGTYTERSCAFTSLNTTKGSGTTLEIGNRTTAAVGVWHDTIAATVTYHNVITGGVVAAFASSPAVTGIKNHPSNTSAAFASDTPCCVTLTTPFNTPTSGSQGVTFSVSVTGTKTANNKNGAVSQGFTTGHSIAAIRAMHGADTAGFSTLPTVTAIRGAGGGASATSTLASDTPCCVTTGYPLAATIHFSPVVGTLVVSNTLKDVGAGLSMNAGASAHAVLAAFGLQSATVHFDPVVTLIAGVPLTTSFHVSPTVAAAKGSNGVSALIHVAPTCQGCVGSYFDGAALSLSALATGVKGSFKLPIITEHISPVVSTVLGARAPVAVGFTSSPTAANNNVTQRPISQTVAFSPNISVVGPTPSNKTVGVAIPVLHLDTAVGESATTTSNTSATTRFAALVRASVGLNKGPSQTLHSDASATAFSAGPKKKFVVIIAN